MTLLLLLLRYYYCTTTPPACQMDEPTYCCYFCCTEKVLLLYCCPEPRIPGDGGTPQQTAFNSLLVLLCFTRAEEDTIDIDINTSCFSCVRGRKRFISRFPTLVLLLLPLLLLLLGVLYETGNIRLHNNKVS